jgi:hypothetical protein
MRVTHPLASRTIRPYPLGEVDFLREEGQRAARGGPDQCVQGRCRDEGHVAVQDQHGPARLQLGQRLHHRMAGAELPLLQREGHVRGGEFLAHAIGPVAHDDAEPRGMQFPGCAEDVGQQRLACKGMEDLRKVRMHALALAGGQDDDLEHLRRPGR